MTINLSTTALIDKIAQDLGFTEISNLTDSILIKNKELISIATFLKNTPKFDFQMLVSITAVDYIEYFEIVYHLLSIQHNQRAILKLRCYDRESPSAPSVVAIWPGAELQEREIWDLMGIQFTQHPNMKRILLWEDFKGHPLRKDYLR